MDAGSFPAGIWDEGHSTCKGSSIKIFQSMRNPFFFFSFSEVLCVAIDSKQSMKNYVNSVKSTAYWHLVDAYLMRSLYTHPIQPDLKMVVL
jgi:hypothetical protein